MYLLIQTGGVKGPVLTALACLGGASLYIMERLRHDPRSHYPQIAHRWTAFIYLAVTAIQTS